VHTSDRERANERRRDAPDHEAAAITGGSNIAPMLPRPPGV
jgi:hypothetical protein